MFARPIGICLASTYISEMKGTGNCVYRESVFESLLRWVLSHLSMPCLVGEKKDFATIVLSFLFDNYCSTMD